MNDVTIIVITVEELKVPQGQSRTVNTPNIEDVTVRKSGMMPKRIRDVSDLAWEENGITYMVVGAQYSWMRL